MFDGIDYRASKAVLLLIPLLGGFSEEQVLQVLPFVLRVVSDANKTVLRLAIDRLVQSRPPPLSRASLLVALHRQLTKHNYLTD